MSREKQSLFENIAGLAAKMPWWIGVLLALISFLILHSIAGIHVTPSMKPGQMGGFAVKQFYVTVAIFFQMIIPFAFLLGAIGSVIKNRKRGMLFTGASRSSSPARINTLSWSEFEMLVGEAFRMQGYAVTETGGGGADGGVDLELRKGNEIFLVQCKQWRAYKVSVNTVRELYGVMAARGAAGGYVVTSGRFTEDARAFASGRNIELIEGDELHAMIQSVESAGTHPTGHAVSNLTPACPICNSVMIKRIAKKGPNPGSAFWGCPKYPACRGARPLTASVIRN